MEEDRSGDRNPRPTPQRSVGLGRLPTPGDPRVVVGDDGEPVGDRVVADVQPAGGIEAGEGALISASVDVAGVLHLLTAGGPGSFGRRILRFAPEPLPVLEGDRDWNNGAVDPTGSRWAAAEADLGDLLVYPVPATRDPNSP